MALQLRNPYRQLERSLGYRFRRRALLEEALTHRSYRFEHGDADLDNQRLEFLGDAVLGAVAAAHLYDMLEDKDEGVMTSLRSQVTSGKALAAVAREIALGPFLRIGKGEERSGGRDRTSNLADALEAVVGAAFLDGGLAASRKIFDKVFVPVIEGLDGDVWAGNPKGKLQEYAQQRWKRGPVYRLVNREGPAHAVVFTVEVSLPSGMKARGSGPNKQEAETAAARHALQSMRRRRRRRRK